MAKPTVHTASLVAAGPADFGGSFARMTGFRQPLPVRFVPEQNWVTTMGNNVINLGRGLATATRAEGMSMEEGPPCLLPLVAIATLTGRWTGRARVLRTEALTTGEKGRAARCRAGMGRCDAHDRRLRSVGIRPSLVRVGPA